MSSIAPNRAPTRSRRPGGAGETAAALQRVVPVAASLPFTLRRAAAPPRLNVDRKKSTSRWLPPGLWSLSSPWMAPPPPSRSPCRPCSPRPCAPTSSSRCASGIGGGAALPPSSGASSGTSAQPRPAPATDPNPPHSPIFSLTLRQPIGMSRKRVAPLSDLVHDAPTPPPLAHPFQRAHTGPRGAL